MPNAPQTQASPIVSDSGLATAVAKRDAVGQVLHLEPDAKPGASAPRRPSPDLAHVHGRRRRPRHRRFSAIRFQTLVDLYLPIECQRRQDVPDRARPGRSRTGAPCAAPTPDGDRSQLMGEVRTLRTMARMETYFLQIAFWMTFVLGGLALVLTLSGLFSVLSYLVEQRKKELSVRMALGATRRNVVRTGAVAIGASCRLRPARRRRSGCGARRRPDVDARGRNDRQHCSRSRSGRLRRQPALHHRGMRARRPRFQRSAPRASIR